MPLLPEHGNCYFCTAWGLTNPGCQPFFGSALRIQAGPDAIFHTTTDLFAALGASLTEVRCKPRIRGGGNGTAQQKIGRRLMDFRRS